MFLFFVALMQFSWYNLYKQYYLTSKRRNTMTIGNRIKNRRKELNLTVDEVAEKLNKNRATIYRYESDEIENLPITILEPLAEILNTTPAYLMGWEENEDEKINTIAAHHDDEDWTEEELKEIDEFKKFVLSKRKNT